MAIVLATSLSAGPVLEVPVEVQDAANDYLQDAITQSRQDSTFFQWYWGTSVVTDCSKLRLGEPYALHLMPNQAIYDFAETGELNFRGECCRVGYVFPIYSGDEWVVTIDVNYHESKWKISGWSFRRGNKFVPWLLSLRTEYPSNQGYCISHLILGDIGEFLIFEKGEKITNIAPVFMRQPIDGLGSEFLGMGPVYSAEHAIPGLRAAAIDYKDRWIGRSAADRDVFTGQKKALEK